MDRLPLLWVCLNCQVTTCTSPQEKKSTYTFPYREYFAIYKVFLHSWFYLNLPNDPIGQNRWLLLLLFKETNQCSRSPNNLTKVTHIREGWPLELMLAPQITVPFGSLSAYHVREVVDRPRVLRGLDHKNGAWKLVNSMRKSETGLLSYNTHKIYLKMC